VVGGDRLAARRTAGRLFRNFGITLADLLRYESGRPVEQLFRELPPPERFAALVRPGRGAILLTVHLGNWEFGAPLLRRLGVKLLVVTLAEPGTGFTELRERARRQWGVKTLVIGQDAFAFVEVLKRLQEGALIALLVDRPPAGSGVEIELFGRPFAASVSAAELARASGCALIPVALPWTPAGYEIIVLPEVQYERSQLGDRESRRALTQEILRAFAPVIRQHPDQWFHFVPIWK
jgi:lauroyl/myristoyl acyltransferase